MGCVTPTLPGFDAKYLATQMCTSELLLFFFFLVVVFLVWGFSEGGGDDWKMVTNFLFWSNYRPKSLKGSFLEGKWEPEHFSKI